MRAISIAAASAVALLSVSAYAQTPGGTPSSRPATAPSTAPATVKKPTPNPLEQADVSKISGSAVYGRDGKEIGSVTTELMRPDSKKIDRLVVRSGGVLGIGGRQVAMPIDKFSWDADKGAFKVDKTADEMKSMAEWESPGSKASTESGSSALPQRHATPSKAGR